MARGSWRLPTPCANMKGSGNEPYTRNVLGRGGRVERYREIAVTLRDWFAGQALAGTLANPNASGMTDDYVKGAWALADAMLAQREKQP